MSSQMYSEKLLTDFQPVLRFFNVAVTGNFFGDLLALSDALNDFSKDAMDDKIVQMFFNYYDADSNGKSMFGFLTLLLQLITPSIYCDFF